MKILKFIKHPLDDKNVLQFRAEYVRSAVEKADLSMHKTTSNTNEQFRYCLRKSSASVQNPSSSSDFSIVTGHDKIPTRGCALRMGPEDFTPRTNRDDIILPEITIDEATTDLTLSLKPALDAIWNTFGVLLSHNYDKNTGLWIE